MPLPSMQDQFAALIAAPSVSCTQPSLDQSNRAVIDLLAGWLGDLGFSCDIQQVSPGKFNLLASFGSASGTPPPITTTQLAPKSLYVTRQGLWPHFTSREACQAMADQLFDAVISGKIKIHIEQRFAMRDVQEAHRALEARKTIGSTILIP